MSDIWHSAFIMQAEPVVLVLTFLCVIAAKVRVVISTCRGIQIADKATIVLDVAWASISLCFLRGEDRAGRRAEAFGASEYIDSVGSCPINYMVSQKTSILMLSGSSQILAGSAAFNVSTSVPCNKDALNEVRRLCRLSSNVADGGGPQMPCVDDIDWAQHDHDSCSCFVKPGLAWFCRPSFVCVATGPRCGPERRPK